MIFLVCVAEGVAAADCPPSAVRWASSSNRLYITGPVICTPSDLDPIVSHAVLERTSKDRKIWMLRANVLLREGATLLLVSEHTGGDVNELRLRSDGGAAVFILADWGNIEVDGVIIQSWDEAAGAPDTELADGRAHILARSREGGESRMQIRNAYLGFLGHGAKSDVYGVAWKVVGTPGDVRVHGELVDSQAEGGWVGAYVSGGQDVSFVGNLLWRSHEAGLAARDTDGLTLVDNDIQENGEHGFYCSRGCARVDVRDSRFMANQGSGVYLRRCAGGATLLNNRSSGNTEAGLAVAACDGVAAVSNQFDLNKRGLRVSSGASENLFERNDLEDNQQGIYVYPGELPPDGDARPRGNVFLRNDLFRNTFAVYSKQADDNQYVRNVVGEFDYHPDGALLFQDSLGTVLAGNVIPSTALIHTRGSAGGIQSRTFITQAGFLPQAIAPLLIETSGQAETFFVETQDITHTQDGSALGTVATPTENTTRLPRISATLYSSVPYFARPASGEIQIWPGTAARWNVVNWFDPTETEFTVRQLVPNTAYRVKKDGVVILTTTSDAAGVVRFSDVVPGGGASTRYEVRE